MADMMMFPNTVEEFMEQYKITDTEQIYTNGMELVPIFRMKQWFEHQTYRMMFVQEAVNTIMNISKTDSVKDKCFRNAARFVQNAIDGEPPDYEQIPDVPERKMNSGINKYPIDDDFDMFREVAKAYEQGKKDALAERTGKWLLNGGRPCECSVCHHEGNEYGDARFCAYCGARMKEGDVDDMG